MWSWSKERLFIHSWPQFPVWAEELRAEDFDRTESVDPEVICPRQPPHSSPTKDYGARVENKLRMRIQSGPNDRLPFISTIPFTSFLPISCLSNSFNDLRPRIRKESLKRQQWITNRRWLELKSNSVSTQRLPSDFFPWRSEETGFLVLFTASWVIIIKNFRSHRLLESSLAIVIWSEELRWSFLSCPVLLLLSLSLISAEFGFGRQREGLMVITFALGWSLWASDWSFYTE